MPRIIRQILRQANTIYGLANSTTRIVCDKPPLSTEDYVLRIQDSGKLMNVSPAVSGLGATVYLPNNVFKEGQIIRVYNSSATSNIRLRPNSDVILHTPATGSSAAAANTIAGPTAIRNVSPFGIATITCVFANTFVITGAGVNPQQG